MGMGQLVEVALEIDVALKEQAEKVFCRKWADFGTGNNFIF